MVRHRPGRRRRNQGACLRVPVLEATLKTDHARRPSRGFGAAPTKHRSAESDGHARGARVALAWRCGGSQTCCNRTLPPVR
jgi:hypothetical protein